MAKKKTRKKATPDEAAVLKACNEFRTRVDLIKPEQSARRPVADVIVGGGEVEGRNAQWQRDGTVMVWLRITPEQRDRIALAVRMWNATAQVVAGRVPKLTRTGYILDAVENWFANGPKQPSGVQLDLPAVKRG